VNNSDLPTAVKSNYYDYSPHGQDIGTPSLKSPSRSIVKLQEAKNSISSMINEMSNKKNQNMDAIERVRAINSEALGFVSNE
jgi:23S rRNA C2498 (ribose-2'-O)-methylase RlmM